jgi:hypothetical protein
MCYFPPKRRFIYIIHGAISQKISTFKLLQFPKCRIGVQRTKWWRFAQTLDCTEPWKRNHTAAEAQCAKCHHFIATPNCHVTSSHIAARSFAFRRLISTLNWLICNHYIRARQTSRSVIAFFNEALVSVRD